MIKRVKPDRTDRPKDVGARLPYVWDYDLNEAQFRALLIGDIPHGRLDRDWAVVRLLEYAPYQEMIRLLGFPAFVKGWSHWRSRIRSRTRLRGLDFLAHWLNERHPELL